MTDMPCGDGCASVPTSGKGSFDGMSSDPVATAASNNPLLSTLVTAVTKAGLGDTLNNAENITVFAPTNDAFAKLSAGTVETLLKPENRDQLTKVLTYHVIPGKLTAAAILKAINAGGGQATLTTVEGSQLTAKLDGQNVVLVDESNRTSIVTKTDLVQSNGVIHVIDTVVLPA